MLLVSEAIGFEWNASITHAATRARSLRRCSDSGYVDHAYCTGGHTDNDVRQKYENQIIKMKM